MKINEILTEEELTEINWRKGLATAALGAAALGSVGNANARVMPGDDPSINRLTGKPNIEQPASDADAKTNRLIDHPRVFGQPGEPEAVRPAMSTSASRNEDGSFTVSYDNKEYQAVMYDKDGIQPRLSPTAQKIIIPMAQLGIRSIGKYIGTIVGDKIYIAK
jgi:hypothetical protein